MPPGNPFVRRNIWSLAPDHPHVLAYGDAVAAMRAKPASDPTSWTRQAEIHGSPSGSPPPLANECRHQSWYFAPWHRMYVHFFERIVRAEVVAAGGPTDWALPFWDYDHDDRRALPVAFRNATRADGSPNPLFLAERAPGINDGTASLDPAITTASFALARPDFTGVTELGGGDASPGGQFMGLTGRLEQTPHNDIHVALGGFMADPATAALDPIFWLHHANIDRLWQQWNASGRTNPTDPRWLDQGFELFDEGGARVTIRCRDVLDIVAQLDYTYPTSRCFVATAVYGDADHDDVEVLRAWRGAHLAPGAPGRRTMRALVAVYDRVGPPLARVVERRPALAGVLRRRVFGPAATRLARRQRTRSA